MNIDLMLNVRDRILREPERVDMETWSEVFSDNPITSFLMGQVMQVETPCHTVCCVFGHTMEAAGRKIDAENLTEDGACRQGSQLLGISEDEARYLFYFYVTPINAIAWRGLNARLADSPYSDLRDKLHEYDTGTPEYAAIVAQAIDRCIERNHKSVDVCAALDAAGPVPVEMEAECEMEWARR